jgi:alginate biosynthesis protein AlgX
LPGAGQEGSVLHYLLSEDYRAGTPPKLLIWELPSNYMLEDELIYRQLIPAIRGGCAKSPRVILSGKLQLAALQQNQRIEVISNSGSQRQALANFDGFLDIRFSDRNIRDFYVITYYDNGERDKAWFRRTAIIDGGQYYLELSRDARFRNANLLSVFLEPTQDSPTATTVDVQLCQ